MSKSLLAAWLGILAALGVLLVLGPLPPRAQLLAPVLVVGGLCWWSACTRAPRVELSLRTLLISAALLRLVALLSTPGLSDDIHRYVWEAEVIARGWSPYAFAPDAPELEPLRRALPQLFASINHPGVSASYPPLYQGAASAVVALARIGAGSEDVFVPRALLGLRVFAGLCDLCVLFPLVALLRALGRSPSFAVVWAWSPLAAVEFAGSGHMDVLGILLWVTALAMLAPALARGAPCPRTGLLALAGAILVKYLPLASLPFALRGDRKAALRGGALVLLVVVLSFTPVLALRGGTQGLLAGLSNYGLRWESTSLVYRFVEPPLAALFDRDGSLTDPRRLGRALVALAWLGLAAWLWLRRVDLLRASWTLLAAFLILSPTLHPWYVAWALPFLALFPSRAWSWLAATVPLCYWILSRWWSAGVWEEPAWLWPVLALPFFGLLLLAPHRSRT